MDKLFLTVLNMSLTGAFVIAAIILARFPLKKAPKIISYSLWAVAGYIEGGVKERVKNVLNFKEPSRVIIVAAVILVAVLSVGLAVNRIAIPNEPPTISVTSGDVEIFWVVGKNQWNGAKIDRLDNFQAQQERIANRDMPYIKNGDKITISFGNSKPDSITLSEIILNENATVKWRTDENAKPYELNFTPFSGAGSFIIEPNYATALSSNTSDYKTGNTIKGYKMVCTWGNNECEYAFVVFGDPAMTMESITGYYEFHITTLDEAQEIVNAHYPDALDVTYLGDETISYTNPSAPVDCYIFEIHTPPGYPVPVGASNKGSFRVAVSKERGIFFTYSNGTWFAFTGLRDGSGAMQNMTLDDIRAIAQKIGTDLTLGDLRDFNGTDIGSGLYVMQYYIENSDYMLLVGSGDMNTVMYANLIHATDGGLNTSIDIRYYDVDKFIKDETKELVRPLPLPIDLETAITQAILNENKNGYNPGDFSAEAYTALTVVEEGNTITAYLMVLYQNYSYRDGVFSELSGSHMPVAITFDKRAGGGYSMTEYWIPRDGSYYAPSIKEEFPANIYEDALDTQKYINAHKMSCYEQAIQYGAVDVDNQIALLLETICSSPAQSSDPGAYIEAHSIEYRELVYYGRYTLDYCFELFEQGEQTGPKGHIMAAVCSDIMPILGETVTGGRFNTGQDWYDAQNTEE